MTKQLPLFETDKAAEDFLEQEDLSEYLTADNLFPLNFEFLPKDEKISLRLAGQFITAIKETAEKNGMSYQKYIRMAVEKSLHHDNAQL